VTTVPTFFLDYTSFIGDSGSPIVIWNENEPYVVGLISGQQRQADKSVTPYEERTVFTPMGLGMALQAPLIRQAIAEWKKKQAH
jgi:hypothetical protein